MTQTSDSAKPALGASLDSNILPDVRKSVRLNLSFPYDWSNPDISNEALILNVLNRGIYTDICRVCAYFGIDYVEQVHGSAEGNAALTRMLGNIKKGFARVQSR